MLPKTFTDALPIINKIENEGHQAYYVGGCVRDFLLKRDVGDIDIATSARPELVQKLFPKVILVGIEHGTVVVHYEGISYEVTTFRLDGSYSDQRRPDQVEFIDRIDEDLERRDFTINALAMDKNGAIIDLFNGRKDLENKVIRTVGNGLERFAEDPLRIIRAVRFSSQLGFTITGETVAQMKETKQDIEGLAIERITNEMTKLFAGEFVNRALAYIRETNIDAHLPIFKENPNLVHLLPNDIPSLSSFGQVIALLHLIHPEVRVERWIKEWKCSNQMKKEALMLAWACEYYDKHGLNAWLAYSLSEYHEAGFIKLVATLKKGTVTVDEINSVRKKLPIQSKKELMVNGHDLIEWFPDRKQGPWLKKALHSVEINVVNGTVENKTEKIKDWLKWNLQEIE